MSVLIKGMEMPKNCDACSFAGWSNLYQTGSCYLLDGEQCFDEFSTDYRTKRSEHCPLIEVPEPHGELIDMDDFLSEWSELESYRTAMRLCGVIPASEESET